MSGATILALEESAVAGLQAGPRVVAVKNKYDPTNLFRVNQNIKPGV